MPNKQYTVKNTAIADQLQALRPQLQTVTKSTAQHTGNRKDHQAERKNHHNSSSSQGRQSHMRQNKTFSKRHAKPKRHANNMTLSFTQQAAVAIASNLAQTQVASWLGLADDQEKCKAFWNTAENHLDTFKALYTQYKKQQNQSEQTNKSKDTKQTEWTETCQRFQQQLDKLWSVLSVNIKDQQKQFRAPAEYQLLLLSALRLLHNIRNATSHAVFRPIERQQVQNSDPEGPLDLIAQPSLCIWLEDLYRNAVYDLDYAQPPYLWQQEKHYQKADKKQDEQHWELSNTLGLPFFLSLFLTKSHTAWLCDQLLETRQKTRRNKRLLSYYSRRDGVSLLSVAEQDRNNLLIREILGYLSLPPIDSADGQQRLQDITQARRARSANTQNQEDDAEEPVPPFRYQRKTFHYLIQVLDRLNQMPELQLRGFWEYNQGTAEEPDWQPEMKPITAVQLAHAEKHKLVRAETYGQNTAQQIQARGGTEKARFVYNTKNNNIRFVLYDAHAGMGADTELNGVMRWRDFLNWVYVVVVRPKEHQKICIAMTEALKNRQSLLQTKQPFSTAQKAEKQQQLVHLPKQLRQYLQGETPDLKKRIAARINFWRDIRLPQLQRAFAPNVSWHQEKTNHKKQGSKKTIPENLMPIHQQAHEILHHMLAVLNQQERTSCSRYKYQKLYALLLRYKQEPDLFWECLATDYPEHRHLNWKLPSKVNKKYPENKRSFHELMQSVLEERSTWIRKDQEKLAQLYNQDHATELEQMAARWRVSQTEDRREPPKSGEERRPERGWQAAACQAAQYIVLPAGFVQNALAETARGNQTCRLDTRDTRTQWAANYAERIRKHETNLYLTKAHYQPELHPQWQDFYSLLQQQKSLATATERTWPDKQERAQHKAAWRKLVSCLNDWHTEDKLCLILAEKLAWQEEGITLPKNQPVHQAFDRGIVIPLESAGEKKVYIEFANSLQIKRHWALGKTAKTVKAIAHNYPAAQNKATPIPAENIQQLLQRYRRRYLEIVRYLLELERHADRHGWLPQEEFQSDRHNKYIPFSNWVKQLAVNAGCTDKECDILKKLRNAALHDGIPDMANKNHHSFCYEDFYQKEAAYKDPHNPGKLAVDGLGSELLQAIKKRLS